MQNNASNKIYNFIYKTKYISIFNININSLYIYLINTIANKSLL
jgi:hypothetical protein